MSPRTLLVRIKQIKHHLTHRPGWLTWIPVINYLNEKISQTLPATHISKMRFSSKMIARSNSILNVHFVEPGFLSVIKTNSFSPSQKNPTATYNHDMIIQFSALNSTGKIKSAAIIYHCSFFECTTSLHIHPGENSSSVTKQ